MNGDFPDAAGSRNGGGMRSGAGDQIAANAHEAELSGHPQTGRILLSPELRRHRLIDNGFAQPDTGFDDLKKFRPVSREQ